MEKKNRDMGKAGKKPAPSAKKTPRKPPKKRNNRSKTDRITDKMVIDAIKLSNHIVANVAEVFKVDWHTARALIDRNEKTKKAWDNANEWIIDVLEEKAQEMAQQDPLMLRYMLDRKGRSRGYGEKLDMDLTTKGEKINPDQPKTITVIHLPEALRPKPETPVLVEQNPKQTPSKP